MSTRNPARLRRCSTISGSNPAAVVRRSMGSPCSALTSRSKVGDRRWIDSRSPIASRVRRSTGPRQRQNRRVYSWGPSTATDVLPARTWAQRPTTATSRADDGPDNCRHPGPDDDGNDHANDRGNRSQPPEHPPDVGPHHDGVLGARRTGKHRMLSSSGAQRFHHGYVAAAHCQPVGHFGPPRRRGRRTTFEEVGRFGDESVFGRPHQGRPTLLPGCRLGFLDRQLSEADGQQADHGLGER